MDYIKLLDNLSSQTGNYYQLQIINKDDQIIQTVNNKQKVTVQDCHVLNGVYRSIDDLIQIANDRYDYAISNGKIYSDATIGLVIGSYQLI